MDESISFTPIGFVESRFDSYAPSEEMRAYSSRIVVRPDLEPGPMGLAVGDDILVFSTDYPHSDSRFPESTQSLLELDLSDESKRKILWDNCARLYGSRVGSALVS